jgi:hypothetical protein
MIGSTPDDRHVACAVSDADRVSRWCRSRKMTLPFPSIVSSAADPSESSRSSRAWNASVPSSHQYGRY